MLPADLLILLGDELQNDPLQLGYGTLLAAGEYARVAHLLETDLSGTRPRQHMTRAEFQLAILPALVRIASLTDNQQKKWDRILSVIQSVESVHIQSAGVQTLIALGQVDGILTAEEAQAIQSVPVVRSEVVLGRAGVLTAEDVQAAWELSQ